MAAILNDLPALVAQYGSYLTLIAVAVLILSGLGLPVPEDIPLLVMGYVCYCDKGNLMLIIPLGVAAVLAGDLVVYSMGRWIGMSLTKVWPFRKFLNADRLEWTRVRFNAHCGKTLFTSRFLPGVRTAVFFSAGAFRIPYWKMLAFNGSAALLSVPTIILAAYYFGSQIHAVQHWTSRAELALVLVIVAIIGLAVALKLARRKANPTKAV